MSRFFVPVIGLDFVLQEWEIAQVKLTADKRCRLSSTTLFRPGAAYNATQEADGTIRIVEAVEKEVPLVKPVWNRAGFLMLPVKVDRKLVAAVIRADRDAHSRIQGRRGMRVEAQGVFSLR